MVRVIKIIGVYFVVMGVCGVILVLSFWNNSFSSYGSFIVHCAMLFAGIMIIKLKGLGVLIASFICILQVFQFYIGEIYYKFISGVELSIIYAKMMTSSLQKFTAGFHIGFNFELGELSKVHYYGINFFPFLLVLFLVHSYFYIKDRQFPIVIYLLVILSLTPVAVFKNHSNIIYKSNINLTTGKGKSIRNYCKEIEKFKLQNKDTEFVLNGNHVFFRLKKDLSIDKGWFEIISRNKKTGVCKLLHLENRGNDFEINSYGENIKEDKLSGISLSDVENFLRGMPWKKLKKITGRKPNIWEFTPVRKINKNILDTYEYYDTFFINRHKKIIPINKKSDYYKEGRFALYGLGKNIYFYDLGSR